MTSQPENPDTHFIPSNRDVESTVCDFMETFLAALAAIAFLICFIFSMIGCFSNIEDFVPANTEMKIVDCKATSFTIFTEFDTPDYCYHVNYCSEGYYLFEVLLFGTTPQDLLDGELVAYSNDRITVKTCSSLCEPFPFQFKAGAAATESPTKTEGLYQPDFNMDATGSLEKCRYNSKRLYSETQFQYEKSRWSPFILSFYNHYFYGEGSLMRVISSAVLFGLVVFIAFEIRKN